MKKGMEKDGMEKDSTKKDSTEKIWESVSRKCGCSVSPAPGQN